MESYLLNIYNSIRSVRYQSIVHWFSCGTKIICLQMLSMTYIKFVYMNKVRFKKYVCLEFVFFNAVFEFDFQMIRNCSF